MPLPEPPLWAQWIIAAALHERHREEVVGDLVERYQDYWEQDSPWHAQCWYAWQVVRSLGPFLGYTFSWYCIMIRNYLLITWRNLYRHKGYTLINTLGLAMGIAVCVLALLYVQHEWRYDRQHSDVDRIVRIAYSPNLETDYPGLAKVPFPVAPALAADYSQVESIMRLYRMGSGEAGSHVLQYAEEPFYTDAFYVAEPTFFDFFAVEFVHGSAQTAFQKANSIVLTEAMAERLFGKGNPIGQELVHQNKNVLEVSAVIKSINERSHLQFDFLSPWAFLETEILTSWGGFEDDWSSAFTWSYLKLQDRTDVTTLEAQLPAFIKNRYPAEVRKRFGNFSFILQPITTIHFDSHMRGEVEGNGNVILLYAVGGIALLILLIACINFMNLATARSMSRAKEVGIRKALGARRGHLVGQFLGEAMVLSIIALAVALVFATFMLPLFNDVSGVQLALSDLVHPVPLIGILLVGLGVGIVAGIYPACVLSALQPTHALKGASYQHVGAVSLRKVLVVVQFAITIVFFVSIGVIQAQMHHMQTKDLGYNTAETLLIQRPTGRSGDIDNVVFREAFMGVPGVMGVSAGFGSMPGQKHSDWTYWIEGKPRSERIRVSTLYGDFNILDLLQVDVIAGRGFSEEFGTDGSGFLLNEAAVAEFGWTVEEALGKQIGQFEWRGEAFSKQGPVLGVLRDFHFESLHEPVKPLIVNPTPNFGALIVKIQPEYVAETLRLLRTQWQELAPATPFDYAFINDNVAHAYQQEQRLNTLMNALAALAIAIACLGLVGLVSYMAARRTKEMGIRKVLGASVGGLVVLLSKDFARLVVYAFIIAAPISYFIMDPWLEEYASRITMTPRLFLVAGLLALGIALCTVGYQAFRAALANPTEVLRQE